MVETKLQYDRAMRDIDNPATRMRERAIKKIMVSYGYDKENAEKVFEIMRVKQIEKLWGVSCGAFAAYKWMPVQRELEAGQSIWRKTWMRYPLTLGIFGATYFIGTQLPTKIFSKLSDRRNGQDATTYKG